MGTRPERVVDNLNRALHTALAEDERVWLFGEDVRDPYGGAFKVSRGLSTRFPDRVVSTPISEAGIVGVAGGLALAGDRPIVEMMFGDFVALAFDPLLNFLSKSVAMYGRTVPMHAVVRCPVGGGRGYGPTHSQSLQKHLVGIPHLELYEASPLHDGAPLLRHLLSRGVPCVLFEDKVLYAERMGVGDLFSVEPPEAPDGTARVGIDGVDGSDVLVVAAGGVLRRVLAAARDLFLRHEIRCRVLVPARLYPFDVEPVLAEASGDANRIVVVEEGTAGGGWGAEVAARLYPPLWGRLAHPIRAVTSEPGVIPAARRREDMVLVQPDTIARAILEVADV